MVYVILTGLKTKIYVCINYMHVISTMNVRAILKIQTNSFFNFDLLKIRLKEILLENS